MRKRIAVSASLKKLEPREDPNQIKQVGIGKSKKNTIENDNFTKTVPQILIEPLLK